MLAVQITSLTIAAAAGAVAGGVVAPKLADYLLKRKLAKWQDWFDRCADGWAEFVDREGRAPSAKARGEEGALGIWAADALRLSVQGQLDHERAARVEELGLSDERAASRLAARREVDALAASAKAAIRASLPKGGSA